MYVHWPDDSAVGLKCKTTLSSSNEHQSHTLCLNLLQHKFKKITGKPHWGWCRCCCDDGGDGGDGCCWLLAADAAPVLLECATVRPAVVLKCCAASCCAGELLSCRLVCWSGAILRVVVLECGYAACCWCCLLLPAGGGGFLRRADAM